MHYVGCDNFPVKYIYVWSFSKLELIFRIIKYILAV